MFVARLTANPGRTKRRRCLRASGALLLAALLLSGCAAQTTPATGIGRTTATLNATGTCSGPPCQWYFRYGNDGFQQQTPVRKVTQGTGGAVSVSEPVSGLIPGTTYRYQLCVSGNGNQTITCLGPSGASSNTGFTTQPSRAACMYTGNSVATMQSWSKQIGYGYGCAMIFDNDRPDWSSWEHPWFLSGPGTSADEDWQAWKQAPGVRRQLIITVGFVPQPELAGDWLDACASGAYDQHAANLAHNLVAAGLGDSVIRLAHEANDDASPFAIPTDAAGQAKWAQCWHHEAAAMKSVPGAQLLLDWCVNAYWRPLPLAGWYPGDDVVDIIGIDAYDSGLRDYSSQPAGWTHLVTQTNGIAGLTAFAAAHGKPLSVPEWGLEPSGSPWYGMGDDPMYVNGMAGVFSGTTLDYESYFFYQGPATLLGNTAGASYAAYVAHFGHGGDNPGSATITP